MTKEQEEAIEILEDIKNNTWTTKYIMSSDSAKAATVLNMLKEKDKEIEKKDKIIDLMAERIRKLAISLANYKGSYNKETINFTGNIKDIKQYFERRARDGRN